MPDATWKDTCIQQVRGNPTMGIEFKDAMVDILSRFSESDCRLIAHSGASGRGRFFYDYDENDRWGIAVLKAHIEVNGLYSQARANAEMRKTGNISNPVFKSLYETTYTRGGHKYVDGRRIY